MQRVRLAIPTAVWPTSAPVLIDSPPGTTAVDLGAVDATATDLEIDVDDAVTSVTVLAAGDPRAHVVVDHVEDGDGVAVVRSATPVPAPSALVQRLSRGFPGPFLSPDRMLAVPAGGAFVLGAHPTAPRAAGTWRVGVAQGLVAVDAAGDIALSPTRGPIRLVVVFDERPRPARLALRVAPRFSGGAGLTAANAETSPVYVAAITATRAALGPAGVDVIVEPAADVDVAPLLALRAGLCEGGQLREAIAALPPTPHTLDVLFVERLTCEVRGVVVDGILGFAGGVPADAFGATGTGAIVVAVGAAGDNAERAGVVVAHEVGHALGLMHVMEQASGADPLIFDTLDDTPDDPTATDNLMVAVPTTSLALTEQQIAQLRRSPWLAADDDAPPGR